MKLTFATAIIALQQTTKATAATSYVIDTSESTTIECPSGEQCCNSDGNSWGTNQATGNLNLGGDSDCKIGLSGGTLTDCMTAPSCVLNCDDGCVVSGGRPFAATTTTTTTTAATIASDTTASTTTPATIASDTAASATASTPSGFAQIEATTGDYYSVLGVDINMPCNVRNVPNTMFTIQPSHTPEVSSFPPNLVTASVQNDVLSFAWNPEVAATSSEGGVVIQLPSENLESISIASQNSVQILEGFNSLSHINVKSGNLKATIKELTTPEILVSGQSTVNIVCNNPNLVEVSGQSNVYLQNKNSLPRFQVSGQSSLNIDGSVWPMTASNGTVDSQSELTVTGEIQSTISVSGQSTLKANTISGEVELSSQSTAVATSCENVAVTGQSTCSIGEPPSVSVDVTMSSLTMSGTSSCFGGISVGGMSGGSSSIGTFSSDPSGSPSASISSMVVAAVGTVVAISTCLMV